MSMATLAGKPDLTLLQIGGRLHICKVSHEVKLVSESAAEIVSAILQVLDPNAAVSLYAPAKVAISPRAARQ